MTKLDKPLRREIDVKGTAYTLTLTGEGLKLVPKGHRKGYELAWSTIVEGDAGLTAALHGAVPEGE